MPSRPGGAARRCEGGELGLERWRGYAGAGVDERSGEFPRVGLPGADRRRSERTNLGERSSCIFGAEAQATDVHVLPVGDDHREVGVGVDDLDACRRLEVRDGIPRELVQLGAQHVAGSSSTSCSETA